MIQARLQQIQKSQQFCSTQAASIKSCVKLKFPQDGRDCTPLFCSVNTKTLNVKGTWQQEAYFEAYMHKLLNSPFWRTITHKSLLYCTVKVKTGCNAYRRDWFDFWKNIITAAFCLNPLLASEKAIPKTVLVSNLISSNFAYLIIRLNASKISTTLMRQIIEYK